MFLAAVLNAYLQPVNQADATPSVELGANEPSDASQGLAFAKVRASAEPSAATQADARNVRARW